MKKGKFIKIGEHENVKIGYGTVDYIDLKSIYIRLNSWVEPFNDNHEFEKTLPKSRKKIKERIYSLKTNFFKKESIVDLDIKTKGVKTNKRSFMDLEITLFVNEHFNIKNNIIKSLIRELSEKIINDDLSNENVFIFNLKKN